MTVGSSNTRFEPSTRQTVAFGVSAFAGVTLSLVAICQVLEGIAAIAEDEIYVRGVDYTYKMDVTAWGWIHVVIGLIGIATAVGILMGQTWGRIAGLVVAFFGALSNFAFIPHYPIWAIVIIAFNVLVMWALCTQLTEQRTS